MMHPSFHPEQPAVEEGYIPVENAALYYRQIGHGQPLVILHGGPDFNHSYLLPGMDRLADTFHLIYYDQRGRGKSAGEVRPEDVSMRSEISDLEAVRTHFHLETFAVLGHSWEALLAMEYAIQYPGRLSHLILLNSAPASRADFLRFRQRRLEQAPEDIERLKAIAASEKYRAGDLEMDAAYYRIHFLAAIQDPEKLENLVRALRLDFTAERIRKARAIEDRLMEETWMVPDMTCSQSWNSFTSVLSSCMAISISSRSSWQPAPRRQFPGRVSYC